MIVVGTTLAARYLLVGVHASGTEKYSVVVVLWVLALGWAAAEARTRGQRALVAVTAAIGVLGFFGDLQRELIVAGSVALLLWARPVALPDLLARLVQVVGSASLWIYLTHWQVYPALEAAGHAPAAVVASVVVGVACHAAYGRVTGFLRQTPDRRRAPRRASRPRAVAMRRSGPRPLGRG